MTMIRLRKAAPSFAKVFVFDNPSRVAGGYVTSHSAESASSDHPVSTRSARKKPECWVVIGLCRDNRDRQNRPRVIQLNSKASDEA